jgi:two-component system, sensor histidine kinase and response regulator
MKLILVIEDDPAVRGLIVDTIKTKGWRVIDAADGEAGLEAAFKELPDLILCDIQMPKMDGYAVLDRVRQNPKTAPIPFIFLTGLGEKPKVRQAMESGADDYIVKPFTVKELTGAIEARLHKQATFQETAEKRLNELRESLTFALPHELVTPLNTILGFSSLLVDSPEISREELHEYALHIQRSGERLKELIEKFLFYAQIETTMADPQQRRALGERAPHVTQETVYAAARRVANEHHRLSDLGLSLASVNHRISPLHLERMVRELLDNAFKFSAPGTPVEVKTNTAGGLFRFQVIDQGRGFSAEQIQRVGANFQFDRKLQEQQGSGLGLSIARRLAEIYGGTLKIESSPGAPTVLTIEIPA